MILFAALMASISAKGASLEEIYTLAFENDPQIKAAEARYLGKREAVPQARAALLPNLTASGTSTDNRRSIPDDPTPEHRFNTHGWQAQITQPLFRIDKWFQLKQAKNIRSQAEAQYEADQQDLIIRVSESYFNILEAQDRLNAAQAEREAVQRQLEQVQQRFDVGLVAITDLLESTAAFDSSTVNVIEAEGAQIITFEALLRLTDRSISNIDALTRDFPVEHPQPMNEEAWVRASLDGNFELAAAREGVSVARRGLTIARSGHYPTIDAAATFSHTVTHDFDPTVIKTDNKVMSLQITVPIFSSGATSSRSREAGYRLEEAQRTFDLSQRITVENARNLYSAINTDVARVRARLRGIESSQSALEATETGYEVGTRNIVDVLQAQQRLYQAQFLSASARYQYIKDVLKLKQVAGALNPADLKELSSFLDKNRTVSKIRHITR